MQSLLASSSEDRSVLIQSVSGLNKRIGKPKTVDPEDDDDEEKSGTEKEQEGAGAAAEKWFDHQSKRAQACRQFDAAMTKTKTRMAATLLQMKEGLDSARGSASATNLGDSIVTEVKILDSRRECLNLVLQGSVEDFTAYISRVKADSLAASETKTVHTSGSANEGILA